MRVAENAFNTHASNKKVKIATPYGQKTGTCFHLICFIYGLIIYVPS